MTGFNIIESANGEKRFDALSDPVTSFGNIK